MCSELAPRAHIPDTRIPQLMQPRSHMYHPFQKVSFFKQQDSKIMLMIICKHGICRTIFVHIFGDICVCPKMFILEVWGEDLQYVGREHWGHLSRRKWVISIKYIQKKNEWCWWNRQKKFDNFSSCPTINTSLSRSSLSSLGEKNPQHDQFPIKSEMCGYFYPVSPALDHCPRDDPIQGGARSHLKR